MPGPSVATQRLGGWLLAACTASLVAGMATGPFAMRHFNRTAIYGLIANLATSPIADFILMPALALGAALEPLGLGAPFLWLAGKGVDLMLAIGHWTADLRRGSDGGERPGGGPAGRLSRHPVHLPVARTAALAGPAPGGSGADSWPRPAAPTCGSATAEPMRPGVRMKRRSWCGPACGSSRRTCGRGGGGWD